VDFPFNERSALLAIKGVVVVCQDVDATTLAPDGFNPGVSLGILHPLMYSGRITFLVIT
jgi:hypothetical protein